jgi:hypothetical protein
VFNRFGCLNEQRLSYGRVDNHLRFGSGFEAIDDVASA